MTEQGLLVFGVAVGEVIHREFSIRLPVVKDTITALTDTQDSQGTTEGPAAQLYYKVAIIASALISLGNLAKEDITTELLLNELTDDDFDIIDAHIAAIKKKRLPTNSSLPDTDLLPSSSVNTESVSNK
ncbi:MULTISPECIES: hypothetical protein [Yersinia]|uniref:Uncharacterized protein n=1 Tax=Yersinia bercovieri ATCC 43970 TaxID=349968 RepID=A0ABP2DZZ8_YERBE|nr:MULTISPECIES: hypothetical protein [Yersinia]EEQ05881.1 hypothetical protein yberc0001_28790 [Yersinia bercovieri ATCC 43970]MCB5313460.1 hypothetical protein [Yersinia intermedia]QKJ05467.1 hypothetical protein HRK25_00105 [Yersinia bercovieri ATCC 43970]